MYPVFVVDATELDSLAASEKSNRARIADIAAQISDLERSIQVLRAEQDLHQSRLGDLTFTQASYRRVFPTIPEISFEDDSDEDSGDSGDDSNEPWASE
ncbi:hypothetical protein C8R43DRAFT_1133572 [Mycena crocata]|nr:hypothetical protein C8R43DRAFT_1133572 [Mycena crocata]